MTLSKSNTLINKKIIDFFPEKVEKILFFNPPSIPGEYYNVDLASRGRYFCYPPLLFFIYLFFIIIIIIIIIIYFL